MLFLFSHHYGGLALLLNRTLLRVSPSLFTFLLHHVVTPLTNLWLVWGARSFFRRCLTDLHSVRVKLTSSLDGVYLSHTNDQKVDHDSLVIFLPGGGWVGRGPMSLPFARELCSRIGSKCSQVPRVLVINYPLPARSGHTVDLLEEALNSLRNQYRRIVVAGDSAGGTMALELGLRAIERKKAYSGVVAVCPFLDFKMKSNSHKRNKNFCFLHEVWLQQCIATYFAGADLATSEHFFSEASCQRDDANLAALPSRAILALRCMKDILADDVLLLHSRAAKAGAPDDAVTIVDVDGPLAFHDSLLTPGLPYTEEIEAAHEAIANYVMDVFALK